MRWKSDNRGRERNRGCNTHQITLSIALVDVFHRYQEQDIFNADETGLLWRPMPNGSHVFKANELSGSKISKEKLTILLCTSMNGEKQPVLVIGKSKTLKSKSKSKAVTCKL